MYSTSDRRQSQNFRELPPVYHQEYRTLRKQQKKNKILCYFSSLKRKKSMGVNLYLNLIQHTFLQAVDILGVHAEQQTFLVKHADEVMDVIGSMSARVQLFGQREERTRVIREVVDIEDCFRVGNVVFFQVGI